MRNGGETKRPLAKGPLEMRNGANVCRRKQNRPALLRTDFVFLVEPWGIEPQTSRVRF